MTEEPNPMSVFSPDDSVIVKPEAVRLNDCGPFGSSKEARQRRLINQIKNLVEQCDDFVGLVPGENGVPEILASPNIKADRFMILGDANSNFSEYLHNRNPLMGRNFNASIHKISTAPNPAYEPENNIHGGSISVPPFQRPSKRPRSKSVVPRPIISSRPSHQSRKSRLNSLYETPASQIRVDNREKLEQWFEQAFLTMQQVACRTVAKVWIKKIHPKKQSTHPYNGGIPRDQPRDPNRTRPDYWPKNVVHREPDHIGREERTKLLVHLIMNTPQPIITNPPDRENAQMVYATDLLDCLEEKRKELLEDKWEIITQIIKTREAMESYETGGTDADACIFLKDYSEGARMTPNDSDNEGPSLGRSGQGIMSDGSREDEEPGEDPELTPSSSSRPSPPDHLHGEPQTYGGRTRSIGDSSSGHRNPGHRNRAAVNAGRSASGMMLRMSNDVSSRMAMGMGEFECHMDGQSSDTSMHDSQAGLDQAHMPPGMMVTIPQQFSPTNYDKPVEHTSHEVVLADQSGAAGMVQCIPLQRHRQSAPYPWMGGMPVMGPEPPAHVFGLGHGMTMPHQEMPNTFFDQPSHEMAAGRMQSGLAVMSPIHYHTYTDESRRALPVRAISTPHQEMMQPTDMNMNLSQGAYYQMP